MRKCVAIPALTALLTLTSGLGAQELLLVGGRVVDVEAQEIRTENLLIRDGVIVGSVEGAPVGFQGETLDISGRWVMPGLVDLHTHSFGNQAPGDGAAQWLGTPGVARRMLYSGVTAFLDLFGLEDAMLAVRASQRADPTTMSDIFTSASCLTAPEGHCTEYGIPTRTMTTPDEARGHVAELAEKGADVIKFIYSPTGRMPSIDRATLAAGVETANQAGLRTVVHVNTWDDVRDAAEVGASAVTHVPGGPIPADLPALMAERGTVSIPTLTVELGMLELSSKPDLLDSPLARAVASEQIRAAYQAEGFGEGSSWYAQQQEQRGEKLANVGLMFAGGVSVLPGTDSGNYGTIQGWSVHHEVLLMAEAGMTPWETLHAATVGAAAFVGREYGISPGDAAHLIVLEASPIEDLRNTQRITHVIHHGTVVDRAALITP